MVMPCLIVMLLAAAFPYMADGWPAAVITPSCLPARSLGARQGCTLRERDSYPRDTSRRQDRRQAGSSCGRGALAPLKRLWGKVFVVGNGYESLPRLNIFWKARALPIGCRKMGIRR